MGKVLQNERKKRTDRKRNGEREGGREERRKEGAKGPHSQRNLGPSWVNQGLDLTSNIYSSLHFFSLTLMEIFEWENDKFITSKLIFNLINLVKLNHPVF